MQRNRRHTRTDVDIAELAALRAKLAVYQRSPSFGCYTRQALDLDILPNFDPTGFDLLYFDIDSLTKLNDQYGKAERKHADLACVNERIAASFAAMRSADIIIGQWFSGDEFIALIPSDDAYGFANRLADVLRSNGVTATMVLITLAGRSIRLTIDAADNLTSAAKHIGLRNRIHDYRSVTND
jgi:GGDEF domain-containing protein